MRKLVIAALLATASATSASAQEWPPRTTSIVLGLGPGSGLDLFARVIVDALQTKLGTNFVLDYRVGAGGNIAVEHVARSVADGSVLGGAIAAPIVTNPMFMKLTIEPLKELAPVTVLGTIPSVVIASKKSGAKSMQDFIAMLKQDPGKYTFSSVGIGTTGHLSVELIALKSGTKMVHVPYKSTPEALQAVMTGEVDMATLTVNLTEQAILTDKVTGIAITSARRWPTLPDIPTIAEAGITDMPVDAWFGLFAPAKTPAAIIDKIAQRGAGDRANPRGPQADRRHLLSPGGQHAGGIRGTAAPGAGDLEAGGGHRWLEVRSEWRVANREARLAYSLRRRNFPAPCSLILRFRGFQGARVVLARLRPGENFFVRLVRWIPKCRWAAAPAWISRVRRRSEWRGWCDPGRTRRRCRSTSSSESRVRARLTRLLIVPTAQSQIAAASS